MENKSYKNSNSQVCASNSDLLVSKNNDETNIKNKINESNAISITSISTASVLFLSCFDFCQLRSAVPHLLQHAIFCAEESAGKIVVPKSKVIF